MVSLDNGNFVINIDQDHGEYQCQGQMPEGPKCPPLACLKECE